MSISVVLRMFLLVTSLTGTVGIKCLKCRDLPGKSDTYEKKLCDYADMKYSIECGWSADACMKTVHFEDDGFYTSRGCVLTWYTDREKAMTCRSLGGQLADPRSFFCTCNDTDNCNHGASLRHLWKIPLLIFTFACNAARGLRFV